MELSVGRGMAFTVLYALYMLVQANTPKQPSASGADWPMYAQQETPAAVPNREAKMYWLVFLAVMSAGSSRRRHHTTQVSTADLAVMCALVVQCSAAGQGRNNLYRLSAVCWLI